jgi:Cdc6-like AAA superfamily ATPase
MSIAGIRSNRGDIYQKLIAFEWALSVLTNSDYLWLETDSTTHLVDDVVIGKVDGTVICCQCKKNQTNFKSWSISDLSDELEKAIQELDSNQNAKVQFYSRDSFGDLAKLKEFSISFSNENQYKASLTKGHVQTEADLKKMIEEQGSNLSTFEFLRRTKFEVTSDFDRLEEKLHESLSRIVTNSDVVFNAIWRLIDKFGGREIEEITTASSQHRLTTEDLKNTLHKVGAILAPAMSMNEVRLSFLKTSAIGRSWTRDIAGEKISNPVLDKLLNAIDAGKRSILLSGSPGSGKTCVMLELQEKLEQRAQKKGDIAPLFIQSREFVDLSTVHERHAQGLPEQWVEQAARLAEDTKVIVVIDSLDVLSIAREHNILTYFLAQLDQLLLIPNITVVTACRNFDKKYDRRLASRNWDAELDCEPLGWDNQVVPLLEKLEIDSGAIDSVTRELIRNPRELSLFVDLALNEGSFNVVTSQALAQRYLDRIVEANPKLAASAMRAIEAIAEEMLTSRSLSVPHQRFDASQDVGSIQQQLLAEINDQIVQDVLNKLLSNW